MSRKPSGARKKADAARGGDDEDVNMLLRAAEDELLLNLSLNSHMARGASHSSSSYLDPDLDRRFQALKNTKSEKPQLNPPPREKNMVSESDTSNIGTKNNDGDLGDDLLARFAKLKSSVTVPPSSSSSFDERLNQGKIESGKDGEEDDDGEDEVQKVIRWAIDSAKLDPSPLSDSDDDDRNSDTNDSGDEDEDDDEEEEDDNDERGKGKKKKKKKKKK